MSARIYNTAELSDGQLGPTVVAIGNFDGVHLAHRVICENLIAKAQDLKLPSVIYTFQPHPRKILEGPHAAKTLTTFEKKCRLLGELGVDTIVWSEFTREFSEQSPADFTIRMLVEKLRIRHIFVGHDSHFAHNRAGNFNVLVELGARYGFQVDRTEAVLHEGLIVSSSQIRHFLEAGEVARANRFLGWTYSVAGTVVRGAARGRAIGFPTANLETDAEILPAEGVYATWTRVGERAWPSVTNVGTNPTFQARGAPVRVETHLLQFSRDIYGLPAEVGFLDRIRGEERFSGPRALQSQIEKDVAAAKAVHAREKLS